MKELRMYRQSLISRYRQAGEDLAALVRSIPPAERQAELHGLEGENGKNSLEQPLYALFQSKGLSAMQVIDRVYADEFQVNFPQIRALLHRQPEPPRLTVSRQAGNGQGDLLDARLDELLRMRREVAGWLEYLPSPAWSLASRSPRMGVRTVQWWVERSLGVMETALQVLKTGIKERA